MRTVVTFVISILLAAVAQADPIHVAFNTPGYLPSSGTLQSHTRYEASVNRDFSFDALDSALNPFGTLYHDADDGGGYADGIGVIGSGYATDEIEGDERLRLRFNEAVHILGFNVTDLFHEIEPNLANCPAPGCYNEVGAVMFYYGDGTHSLWQTFTAPDNSLRAGTNGPLDILMNEDDVMGMVFASLGYTQGQYHEFSLAGVLFDVPPPTPEVPEPGTLILLGSGLIVVARYRRRG